MNVKYKNTGGEPKVNGSDVAFGIPLSSSPSLEGFTHTHLTLNKPSCNVRGDCEGLVLGIVGQTPLNVRMGMYG